MPTPSIPLKKGVHRAVFRALVSILQEDPVLSGYVTTWRSWTGGISDADEPSFFDCPWVRLTPYGDPQYMRTVDQHEAPLLVRIETLQEGNRIDDAMDLFQAIVDCLFPDDRSVLTKLNNALSPGKGGYRYSVKQPNFGLTETAAGVAISGTATIQIGILLDTRT